MLWPDIANYKPITQNSKYCSMKKLTLVLLVLCAVAAACSSGASKSEAVARDSVMTSASARILSIESSVQKEPLFLQIDFRKKLKQTVFGMLTLGMASAITNADDSEEMMLNLLMGVRDEMNGMRTNSKERIFVMAAYEDTVPGATGENQLYKKIFVFDKDNPEIIADEYTVSTGMKEYAGFDEFILKGDTAIMKMSCDEMARTTSDPVIRFVLESDSTTTYRAK